MKKYLFFVLIITFAILSCKDYPEPFNLVVENETDSPISVRIAFWNFYPDPKPSGMYKDDEFSMWIFYCNIDGGGSESYRLKGASVGGFDYPNEALRFEIAEITFLDNNGEILQSFDGRYKTLLLSAAAPEDVINEWEFPVKGRPFYLRLDEDGKTGRIIITDIPVGNN